MQTRALRLHGAGDLRIDTFELPAIKDDEILVEIISDSLCMSSYKCATLGAAHKRVHDDVAGHPAIIGHEFAGNIVEVGKKHQGKFRPGMKFTIQPAINYQGTLWSPGYSYEFCGGNATYAILPAEVMECGCLFEYTGEAYYEASLAEPMSCSIGAFNAAYHTKLGVYTHEMGIKQGGKLAILAGAGPMGLGAISYALNADRRPSLIAVTDIDETKLQRARELFPPEEAKKRGIELLFLNTAAVKNPVEELLAFSDGGFDDVFAYAPVRAVVEMGSDILGNDGCFSFFAGPTDPKFKAELNFYDVHYNATHVLGTSGGNTDDMVESLELTAARRLNPAVMVTHIGGLDAAKEATLTLPKIPGGKKLIYPHIDLALTAIDDFASLGKTDQRFAALHDICNRNQMLWCAEAERYLLENFKGAGKG